MRLRWLQEIDAKSVRKKKAMQGPPPPRVSQRGHAPQVPLEAQFVWCALYVGLVLHPLRAAAASVNPFALAHTLFFPLLFRSPTWCVTRLPEVEKGD